MTRHAATGAIILALLLTGTSAVAQDARPAADTCVVAFNLPKGATVNVDGRDYGERKSLTFRSLAAGKRYRSAVVIRFPSGKRQERTVYVEGGRRIDITSSDPGIARPELVVQSDLGWASSHVLSRDGTLFAFGGNDGTMSVWDVALGRKLRSFATPSYGGEPAFSPDNRFLAASDVLFDKGLVHDNDRFGVVVWEIATGKRLRVLSTPGRGRCYFSADGRRLITTSERHQLEKSATVWNTTTWKAERNMPGMVVAVSRDGSKLASMAGDAEIAVYEVDSGQEVQRITLGDDAWLRRKRINSGAFDNSGRHLVTNVYSSSLEARGTSLSRWDLNDGEKEWESTIPGYNLYRIDFTPNGKEFAATTTYKEDDRYLTMAVFFDEQTGRETRKFEVRRDPARQIAGFAPDGRRVFVADSEYDVSTGERIRTLEGTVGSYSRAEFLPDGKRCLINNSLWDFGTGKVVCNYPGSFARLCCNGRVVLIKDGENHVLCDVDTGKPLGTLSMNTNYSTYVAPHPDGRRAVIAAGETCALWDLTTNRKLKDLPYLIHPKHKWPRTMSFSPDGGTLVAAYESMFQIHVSPLREVNFWNVETDRKVRTLGSTNEYWADLVFDPTGRYLLIGVDQVDVLVVEPSTGRTIRRLEGPANDTGNRRIWTIAVSKDGRKALATYAGGLVRLWDVAGGQVLRTVQAHHTRYFRAADFTPDGRYFLTGASDGAVKLWDVATGDEIVQIVNVNESGEWLVSTSDGLFDGSPKGREAVTYRVGGGLNVVPVDRFFQDFYRPGLLASVWRGERPLPQVGLGGKTAPAVKIVSPAKEMKVDAATAQITVEVTDRGGGILGPWLMQNGVRVMAPGEPVRDGKLLRQTFSVALVEGENRIEVHAASEDGGWESEPASIVVRYAEKTAEPQLHLVAIGVSRYAEPTMNLKFAAADAKALAELFTARGPGLYGEGRIQTTLLLDEAATTEGIQQALADVAAKAKPQDTLVLFLAGHGAMVGQRYYFIPHQFKKQADSVAEDIRAQGLPGDALNDSLARIPALKRVVIYDTCQSGGAVQLAGLSRNAFAFRGALERMSRATGSFTIAATAANADAQESNELKHGILTYALLAGMSAVDSGPLASQKADARENVVEVRDWFGFAQDKVPLLTKLYFGQEQFVGFSGQGASFPVLPTK